MRPDTGRRRNTLRNQESAEVLSQSCANESSLRNRDAGAGGGGGGVDTQMGEKGRRKRQKGLSFLCCSLGGREPRSLPHSITVVLSATLTETRSLFVNSIPVVARGISSCTGRSAGSTSLFPPKRRGGCVRLANREPVPWWRLAALQIPCPEGQMVSCRTR